MPKFVRILLVAAAVLAALGLARHFLFRHIVSTAVARVTGTPVEIDEFSVGILRPVIRMKGFRLHNPEGFPDGSMIDLKSVEVEYDRRALLKGSIQLPLVAVDLSEFVVVKDAQGRLNVDALKVLQQEGEEAGSGKRSEEPAAKPVAIPIRIDELRLNIDRVAVEDLTRTPPLVKGYDLGLRDKTFRNIHSIGELVTIVLVQGMGPTAIKSAGLVAAAAMLGTTILPAGALIMLTGKANGTDVLDAPPEKVYAAALEALRALGEVTLEAAGNGVIRGRVQGCEVEVKITRQEKTMVDVSAKKMLLPRRVIAEGVLHEIRKRARR